MPPAGRPASTTDRCDWASSTCWIAASAVLLKFSVAAQATGGGLPDSLRRLVRLSHQLLQLMGDTINAAGRVGAAVLVLAKVRRAADRLQPGQWIALSEAVAGVVLEIVRWVWGPVVNQMMP